MKVRSALIYTVLRLLFFLVPFGLLMLFPVFREQGLAWLAAVFAALIGLSLSLLFLRRPLAEVTGGLAERRAQRAAEDAGDSDDASEQTDARRDAGSRSFPKRPAPADDADAEDAADDARRAER